MVAPDKQLHREFNDSLSHRLVVEQTLLINQPAPFIRMLDSRGMKLHTAKTEQCMRLGETDIALLSRSRQTAEATEGKI